MHLKIKTTMKATNYKFTIFNEYMDNYLCAALADHCKNLTIREELLKKPIILLS